METYNAVEDNFRSGRFTPGFWKYESFQVNPFVKYKGLEFFGVYEIVNGDKSRAETGGTYTQIGTELIYRFGSREQFYAGGRYNLVKGHDAVAASTNGNSNSDNTKSIDRSNIGGGWFLTNEIIIKAEYVIQNYSGDGWKGSVYEGGKFNGIMIESVIGF